VQKLLITGNFTSFLRSGVRMTPFSKSGVPVGTCFFCGFNSRAKKVLVKCIVFSDDEEQPGKTAFKHPDFSFLCRY
jgi:hypothetical protein